MLSPGGRPLAEATVTAITADGNVAATVVTDENGHYRLDGLPAGEYTVVASQFAPVAEAVRVGQAGDVRLDVAFDGTPDCDEGGNEGAVAHSVVAAVTQD